MPVKTPIWFDSLKNVDLTSNSLIFTAKKKQSIEENKKKTLRYTNLRLIGHYLNVNAETPAACWNLCKQDSFRCEAISYATIETRYFATQCFLFDFYSVHNDQNYLTDSFWITYLKADLIMNKKLEKIAPSKILKTCAFNNPCKENFICKDENNFEQKCYLRVKTDLIESTTVTNWGDWNHEEYCPEGTFAIGFNMKLEPYQARDNTAMNGLQLICERNFFIQSGVGGWGTWGIDVYCNNSLYLNGFRLKVEKPQPKQDDTATNSVEFSCADGRIISPLGHWENKNVVWNYGGIWGDWTEWKYCPEKSFICGLQTQIEKTYIWNDDTALNNIKLFCCKIQLESTQN